MKRKNIAFLIIPLFIVLFLFMLFKITTLEMTSKDTGSLTSASDTGSDSITPGTAFDMGQYPLKVSSNGRYLVDQNNEPFLIIADTGWMLFSYINEEEAEYYLEERRKSGVNSILCYSAPFVVGRSNANGDAAFIDNDISKPNDAYYEYVDRIIRLAGKKGMQVIMCPCEMCNYSSYFTVEKARELGRYFGNRYKDFNNIMWFTGGDIHPNRIQANYCDAFVHGLLEYDTNHIVSFHPAGGKSSSDYFNNCKWLDYNMVQVHSPDSPVYRYLHADYEKINTRPTMLAEPCYEDMNQNTPYQIRRSIAWGFLSGGCGLFYGNGHVYKYIPPDWKAYLNRPAYNHFINMANCFKKYKWHKLVPDTKGKLIISGRMDYGSLEYAAAAIADDGSFAIAYIPTGREITVNMECFNGSKTVKWYDATENTFIVAGTYSNSGFQRFPAQPANSQGQYDWFLIIE